MSHLFTSLPRDSSADMVVDLEILRSRHELAQAVLQAQAAGVAKPTAFIARTADFYGLAFARELLGARGVNAAGHTVLVGCESRNVVACALLAVDAASSQELLSLSYDEHNEVPVIVLGTKPRVLTVGLDMLGEPPPSSRRAILPALSAR
jgi:hypothetical protein